MKTNQQVIFQLREASRLAAFPKFARNDDWIDDADADALTYCHGVRNEAYHSRDADVEDCELSILLLASYLREHLPRHHSGK